VAISNERIVGIDGNTVAFRVRADPVSGKKRTVRLPGTEFIGRFLQHVLPSGFKRIRHYGLLSPARKRIALPAARAALGMPPPEPAVIESVADFLRRVARIEHEHCPHCGVGRFGGVVTILPVRGTRFAGATGAAVIAAGDSWGARRMEASKLRGDACLRRRKGAPDDARFGFRQQSGATPLEFVAVFAQQRITPLHAKRLTSREGFLQSPS
jgi:hypothetical protein